MKCANFTLIIDSVYLIEKASAFFGLYRTIPFQFKKLKWNDTLLFLIGKVKISTYVSVEPEISKKSKIIK